MGCGTGELEQSPAVETLRSGSRPFLLRSCTNETTECFSGTLRSLADNLALLRIAASGPLTGLKYYDYIYKII